MKEGAVKRPQSKGKTLCWDSFFFFYFFSKRRYLSRAFSAKFSSDDGLKSTLRKKKSRLLPGLYDLTWTTVTMSSHNSIIGHYNCACTARRPFCTSLGTGCLRRQNGHPWLWGWILYFQGSQDSQSCSSHLPVPQAALKGGLEGADNRQNSAAPYSLFSCRWPACIFISRMIVS